MKSDEMRAIGPESWITRSATASPSTSPEMVVTPPRVSYRSWPATFEKAAVPMKVKAWLLLTRLLESIALSEILSPWERLKSRIVSRDMTDDSETLLKVYVSLPRPPVSRSAPRPPTRTSLPPSPYRSSSPAMPWILSWPSRPNTVSSSFEVRKATLVLVAEIESPADVPVTLLPSRTLVTVTLSAWSSLSWPSLARTTTA